MLNFKYTDGASAPLAVLNIDANVLADAFKGTEKPVAWNVLMEGIKSALANY